MEDITLTSHQQEAVDWLVERLRAGEKLLALRGLAGTGKTSVIPALQAALQRHGLPVTIAAPTNRAAHILRIKGLPDAGTIHHHALVTYFTADYRRAAAWLGEEDLQVLPTDTTVPRPDVEGLPWLVHDAVQPDLEVGRKLRRQKQYKARRLLTSIGISLKPYIAGRGPKAGVGVLIVDEASMVGESMLEDCQHAYPQVVLVGDPGQLPPVGDTPVLATVPGIELEELHRQAADSPIVTLAYRARQSEPFWEDVTDDPLAMGAPVRMIEEVSARRFLTCPLLVWQNDTRRVCTKAIRKALGYKSKVLMPGEPLVCKETDPDSRALGFFNNAMFRVVTVDPDDPRRVTVVDDDGEQTTIWVHIEEMDDTRPAPRAMQFRLGYVYTVHTAQGGEWPRVYVSLRSILALRREHPAQLPQWAYTAITRAKTHLRLLTQHTFTPPQERSPMPERTATPTAPSPLIDTSPPLLATPPSVEERLAAAPGPTSPVEAAIFGADDDLPAIEVPVRLQEALKTEGMDVDPLTSDLPLTPARFGEHEALLQGFCQHLLRKFDDAVQTFSKDMMKPVDEIYTFVHHQLQIQREKAQQAETLLDTLTTKAVTQGIQLRHDPYTVTVQTLSPQGFPVTLALHKADKGALVEELGALVQWLAHNGYKPVGAGL